MDFKTGDIIKATIRDNPFFFHSGIVLLQDGAIMIAHNTPSIKNASGGNVVVERVEDFLAAGRKIVSRKSTDMTYDYIIAAIEAIKGRHFNVLDFNCEDFVYYVRTGKHKPALNVMFPFKIRI